MASSREYLSFILEQLAGADDFGFRPMMGEYIIYCRGKVVGGIYDDRFLVKPTASAAALIPYAEKTLPYEGAKEMLLVDNVDDRDFLRELLIAVCDDLSAPKKRPGTKSIKKQISRIEKYEAMLNEAAALLKKSPADGRLPGLIKELEAYYSGAEWREDFAADEAGLLPEDLKRGVLSEDAVYDLLDEYAAVKNSSLMTACCGLDCGSCEARLATVNGDDALREKVAAEWSALNGVEITPDMINCVGCRVDGPKTPFCESLCPIRLCAAARGADTCADCAEMDGCDKLGMITGNNPEALKRLKDIRSAG